MSLDTTARPKRISEPGLAESVEELNSVNVQRLEREVNEDFKIKQ